VFYNLCEIVYYIQGVSRIAHDSSQKQKLLGALSSKFSQKAERLFVTHPVKELLFEGYGAKVYEEIGVEHNGAMSESGADFMVPESLMDGKFALMDNVRLHKLINAIVSCNGLRIWQSNKFLNYFFQKNNTDDGYWEIWTGRTNASAFGLIKFWNGLDVIPYWGKEPCNFFNGTDGMIFTPPMRKHTVVRTYETEFCRARKYTYEMDTEVKGLATVRFKPMKGLSESPLRNPDNECFCPYDDMMKCNMNGVETISPCMEGNGFDN